MKNQKDLVVEVCGVGTVKIHDNFFEIAEDCLINGHVDEQMLIKRIREDSTISEEDARDAAKVFVALYRQIDN